jgi:hypothetical protein
VNLGDSDALGAGALRTLSAVEGHFLTLSEFVEANIGAGGVVKEILVAVARQNKAEAFVADESLDCAVH